MPRTTRGRRRSARWPICGWPTGSSRRARTGSGRPPPRRARPRGLPPRVRAPRSRRAGGSTTRRCSTAARRCSATAFPEAPGRTTATARARHRVRDGAGAAQFDPASRRARPARTPHAPARPLERQRVATYEPVPLRAPRRLAPSSRPGALARHGERPRTLHGPPTRGPRGTEVRDRAERRPGGAPAALSAPTSRARACWRRRGARQSSSAALDRTRAPELAGSGRSPALVRADDPRAPPARSRHQPAADHERRGARGATIRDIGCWDPLPLHLQQAHERGGHPAQVEFWGPQRPVGSMLAQSAAATA